MSTRDRVPGPLVDPRGAVLGLAAALATLLLPGSARAQVGGQDSVRPGERVQVTSPALVHWRAEGRLLSFDGRTLTLAGDDGRVRARVPVDQVQRLRVLRGRADARWRGAFLGAPVGFILGVAVDEETRNQVTQADQVRNSLRIGGLVGGALLGWAVGRTISTDVWVSVSPSSIQRGSVLSLAVGAP